MFTEEQRDLVQVFPIWGRGERHPAPHSHPHSCCSAGWVLQGFLLLNLRERRSRVSTPTLQHFACKPQAGATPAWFAAPITTSFQYFDLKERVMGRFVWI